MKIHHVDAPTLHADSHNYSMQQRAYSSLLYIFQNRYPTGAKKQHCGNSLVASSLESRILSLQTHPSKKQ
eukprot:6712137-Ditylum_brightwellii.AAC.1